MIAKEKAKREQTHPVCLHGVEKYKKVKSVNTHNYYETMSKKWADKNKTNLFCVFCKSVNFQENTFKIVQKNC